MGWSERVLVTWIGRSDSAAADRDLPQTDLGPVLRLLQKEQFTEVHLLNDMDVGLGGGGTTASARYAEWLVRQRPELKDRVHCHDAPANLQNDYARAYEFTRRQVEEVCRKHRGPGVRFGFLLSAGYPAAQAAMLIASQTLFEPSSVEIFNTSPERGVERVNLSYHLSIDVVPALLDRWSRTASQTVIPPCFDTIIGASRAITAAKRRASRVAQFGSVPVLIRGETGTGKELFARAIHEASPRNKWPFVVVHCAALSAGLIESELFGHVKGAVTDAWQDREGKLAEAHCGTLFLDEVGDVPVATQVKLLRFLESGEFSPVGSNEVKRVDVRIISATNRDLERGIREGWFREDFFWRLGIVTVELPPLRYRGKDVQELACKFLEDFNNEERRPGSAALVRTFSKEALALLSCYPWPGNVRQLKHAVLRLAVFSRGPEITERTVCQGISLPPA